MYLILMAKVEVGESWNGSLGKISTAAGRMQRDPGGGDWRAIEERF